MKRIVRWRYAAQWLMVISGGATIVSVLAGAKLSTWEACCWVSYSIVWSLLAGFQKGITATWQETSSTWRNLYEQAFSEDLEQVRKEWK